jgi:hypothetical protein
MLLPAVRRSQIRRGESVIDVYIRTRVPVPVKTRFFNPSQHAGRKHAPKLLPLTPSARNPRSAQGPKTDEVLDDDTLRHSSNDTAAEAEPIWGAPGSRASDTTPAAKPEIVIRHVCKSIHPHGRPGQAFTYTVRASFQ